MKFIMSTDFEGNLQFNMSRRTYKDNETIPVKTSYVREHGYVFTPPANTVRISKITLVDVEGVNNMEDRDNNHNQ